MITLVAGVGLLAIAACLLACLLRPRGVVSFVLTGYLLAWALVVVIVVVLSTGGWVERGPLLGALLAAALASGAAWTLAGRPQPPSILEAARHARLASADPLVAIPLAASAIALVYTLVVTLTTAPNDGDPLVYEIARAAFWRQHDGIVYLEATYEARLDFSPPVAETGILALLVLSETERAAGLVQWLAVPILAVATYGVGRRLGLDRRAALWGASLVPTLPVVITQSWSAFTDLVFASFAVSAVYFAIGALGMELVPFALVVALGVGTKFVGPLFMPLFALVVAVAQPIRRWPQIVAAGAVGVALASTWYVRTQRLASDPAGNSGVGLQSLDVGPVVTTLWRLASDLLDLSGARGVDIWVYAIVAAFVVGISIPRSRARLAGVASAVVTGVLIALVPWLVDWAGSGWARAGVAVAEAFGRADAADELDEWARPSLSDGALSWFGPAGAILVLGALPVAVVAVRRRMLSPAAIVVAASPPVALATLAFVVAYQRAQGRYLISTLALCLTVWGGVALRRRWVGTTLVALATTTMFLSLVNSAGKPTGISLLGEERGRSVWSLPRWMQQSILRATLGDEALTMRWVERNVPDDARIGIALQTNSFTEPYFGPHLRRTITIVDEGGGVPGDVDWLVAAPERSLLGCARSWRRFLAYSGWGVWRRVAPDRCPAPTTLR